MSLGLDKLNEIDPLDYEGSDQLACPRGSARFKRGNGALRHMQEPDISDTPEEADIWLPL